MSTPRRPMSTRPVSDAVVHVLLRGWSSENPKPANDDADWDDLFFDPAATGARLWRQHEEFLLREADRLAIARPFYCETVSDTVR